MKKIERYGERKLRENVWDRVRDIEGKSEGDCFWVYYYINVFLTAVIASLSLSYINRWDKNSWIYCHSWHSIFNFIWTIKFILWRFGFILFFILEQKYNNHNLCAPMNILNLALISRILNPIWNIKKISQTDASNHCFVLRLTRAVY